MSHDRGCPCGLDRYEYAACRVSTCLRRDLARSVANTGYARNGMVMVIERGVEHVIVSRRLHTDDVLRRVRRRP